MSNAEQPIEQTPAIDPMAALIAAITFEQRRIGAASATKDPVVAVGALRNEVAETVLSIVHEGFTHLYAGLRRAYAALEDHASQLDDIEDRIEAPQTSILPEDADMIKKACQAFILLASELREGRVPTVDDAVRAVLDEQIANATAVLEMVEASTVSEPDEDEEEDGEGDEDEEDA